MARLTSISIPGPQVPTNEMEEIMFDKLEDLLRKFEEIMNELSEPTVADNQERFRALMKE